MKGLYPYIIALFVSMTGVIVLFRLKRKAQFEQLKKSNEKGDIMRILKKISLLMLVLAMLITSVTTHVNASETLPRNENEVVKDKGESNARTESKESTTEDDYGGGTGHSTDSWNSSDTSYDDVNIVEVTDDRGTLGISQAQRDNVLASFAIQSNFKYEKKD